MHSISPSITLDLGELKIYIQGSYTYGRYADCLNWCSLFEAKVQTGDDFHHARVIRAKALYHLYKAEQNKLKLNSPPKDKLILLNQNCYKKTKEVIGILGHAFDHNLLDSEGSKMLDIAMMDYIHATNKLNDCKRCYLCCRNLRLPLKKQCESQNYDGHDVSTNDEFTIIHYVPELPVKLSIEDVGETGIMKSDQSCTHEFDTDMPNITSKKNEDGTSPSPKGKVLLYSN